MYVYFKHTTVFRNFIELSHLYIDVIVYMINNLCFSTASFKSAVVKPLLKNLHLTVKF